MGSIGADSLCLTSGLEISPAGFQAGYEMRAKIIYMELGTAGAELGKGL